MRAARADGRVVVSAIEHDSVLDVRGVLSQRGFEVSVVGADRAGVVQPDALEELLSDDCALVSVMAANNETGVIQPVPELARVAHAHGALFHTDAVQAFCHVPLSLADADAVSVAAHKIGGPVGVGALVVRGRAPLRPQVLGGGQEARRRAGTQDVRGALAFAAAARACDATLEQTRATVAARAGALYARLCAPGTGIEPTVAAVADEGRLPGIVSVMAPAVDLGDADPGARPGGLRGLGGLGLLLGLARRKPRPSRHGHPARPGAGVAAHQL